MLEHTCTSLAWSHYFNERDSILGKVGDYKERYGMCIWKTWNAGWNAQNTESGCLVQKIMIIFG